MGKLWTNILGCERSGGDERGVSGRKRYNARGQSGPYPGKGGAEDGLWALAISVLGAPFQGYKNSYPENQKNSQYKGGLPPKAAGAAQRKKERSTGFVKKRQYVGSMQKGELHQRKVKA